MRGFGRILLLLLVTFALLVGVACSGANTKIADLEDRVAALESWQVLLEPGEVQAVDQAQSEGVWVLNGRLVLIDLGSRFQTTQWRINGESMRPALMDGDRVLTTQIEPDTVTLGQLVVVDRPKVPVLHRVVATGADSRGWFALTKGDAVPEPDHYVVRSDMVLGVARIVLPTAGWRAPPEAIGR